MSKYELPEIKDYDNVIWPDITYIGEKDPITSGGNASLDNAYLGLGNRSWYAWKIFLKEHDENGNHFGSSIKHAEKHFNNAEDAVKIEELPDISTAYTNWTNYETQYGAAIITLLKKIKDFYYNKTNADLNIAKKDANCSALYITNFWIAENIVDTITKTLAALTLKNSDLDDGCASMKRVIDGIWIKSDSEKKLFLTSDKLDPIVLSSYTPKNFTPKDKSILEIFLAMKNGSDIIEFESGTSLVTPTYNTEVKGWSYETKSRDDSIILLSNSANSAGGTKGVSTVFSDNSNLALNITAVSALSIESKTLTPKSAEVTSDSVSEEFSGDVWPSNFFDNATDGDVYLKPTETFIQNNIVGTSDIYNSRVNALGHTHYIGTHQHRLFGSGTNYTSIHKHTVSHSHEISIHEHDITAHTHVIPGHSHTKKNFNVGYIDVHFITKD